MAMTLEQVRDRLRTQASITAQECADAIDAHISQPAQAVDVTDAEIAEWAERHDLSFGGSKTDARDAFEDAESHHLTRAIGTAQNGCGSIEQAINYAAEHLPAGAEIAVNIEKDAATVSACDWDGNWREFDSADMTFPEQIIDCVKWCNDQPLPTPPTDGEG